MLTPTAADLPPPSCESCRYFKINGASRASALRLGLESVAGRCRRYPDDLMRSKDDWCGEFFRAEAQETDAPRIGAAA